MRTIKILCLALAAVMVSLTAMASMPYTAPTPPAPSSPLPGQYVTSYTPTLQWTAATTTTGTITEYQAQYSLSNIFVTATTCTPAPLTALKCVIPTNLQPGKIYYWHVRAKNSANEWSSWSVTTFFRTVPAPTQPMPQLPLPGHVITDYTPTLTWLGSTTATGTGIAGYQIEVSLSSTFSYGNECFPAGSSCVTNPPSGTPVIAKTFYTLTTRLPARTYYWRVRARSSLGIWSDWSLTTYFRSAIQNPVSLDPKTGPNSVPDFPGTGGPGDGIHGNSNLLTLRPLFRWSSFTGTQSFTFQLSKECNFSTGVVSVTVAYTANAYIPTADLLPSTNYCWRVRANNPTYGPSGWSRIQAFLTPNPPSIPNLTAPVNKTLTNDYSPRFEWTRSLLPAGVRFGQYEIEISDKPTFKNYTYHRLINSSKVSQLGNITNTYYDVPDDNNPPADPLPGGRTYYWRVRSYNQTNYSWTTTPPTNIPDVMEYSGWSSVRSLLITVDRPINLTTKPNPPTDLRPLFDWDDVYSADIYHIMAWEAGVPEPIIDFNVRNGSQYRPTTDLPAGATIIWKVWAKDSSGKYGESLDSEAASFLSANSPTTPEPNSPALGTIITDTTPTFKWMPSTFPSGASLDHYEIVIAENAAFTINVITKNVLTYAYTPATPLGQGKKYYWHVRACDTTSACSAWSTLFYFTIQ